MDPRALDPIGQRVDSANIPVTPLTQPLEAAAAAPATGKDQSQQVLRKFTACEGCRKQKIKCDMPNEEPPCVRCQRRSLTCVLNKNVQALLEDSRRTDQALRRDIVTMHQTLDVVCRHLNLEVPKPLRSRSENAVLVDSGSGGQSGEESDCEVSPPGSPAAVQAPIDTFLEVVKLTSPGSGDQSLGSRKPSTQQDMLTKAIITTQVADRLLDRYFNRLDHYLYGIASMYKDARTARQASPILFAAICTVSALHEPDSDHAIYEACNREFRRLVARSLFDKRDLEYIRALCIASFWLSDAARILSADAIRRAGDMRLQRFFRRALQPDSDKTGSNSNMYLNLTRAQLTDRVRLWYLLFVCDNHMSILHNRDALLRSDREITTEWESFLEREGREDNDVRILSQMSLLLIMAQVRDTLGTQGDDRLAVSMYGQLMMFSRQLDKWFARFSALFKPNPQIGGFPAKGLKLHYHFGKLNLGHHVFQGLHGEPVPDLFVSVAIMAHDAATAIFSMILSDELLQGDLVGIPHYFHIMIAFAGHFLLEVCHKYHSQLSLNLHEDLNLISRVLMLFENIRCHPQHPLRRMTPGLGQKLYECAATLNIQLEFGHGNTNGNEVATATSNVTGVEAPAKQPMQFASVADNNNWQYVPAQQMEEMAFGSYGEFEFPNMSLNFMT